MGALAFVTTNLSRTILQDSSPTISAIAQVQSLLTKWLALHMHYLIANLVAIGLASLFSFVANDRMTFRRGRAKSKTPTDAPEKP